MKKIYNKTLFAFLAMALSFTACTSDAEMVEAGPGGEELVELTFTAADNDTRTYIEATGEDDRPYRIRWSESDELLVFYANNSYAYSNLKATISSYDREKNTAVFTGAAVAGKNYYGIYPYAAYANSYISNASSVTVNIPDEQTPTATSYDPAADLLMTTAGQTADANGNVAFSFTRAVAIANMNLRGIHAGETIEKIEFTGNNKIAGGVILRPDAGTYAIPTGDVGLNKITLHMSNYTAAVAGEEEVVPVWFTAFPSTLTSMTVKATTTDGTKRYAYEKTVDLGSGQELKRARVTRFGVAFSAENRTELGGDTPGAKKVFKKLTDASQLQAGTEIVFLSPDNKLMGTTAQTPFLGKPGFAATATVTVTDDTIEDVTGAQIFTIEGENGSYYLKNQDGSYLNTGFTFSSGAVDLVVGAKNSSWSLNDNLTLLANSQYNVYYNSFSSYFCAYKNDGSSENTAVYYAVEVGGGATDPEQQSYTFDLASGDYSGSVFSSTDGKISIEHTGSWKSTANEDSFDGLQIYAPSYQLTVVGNNVTITKITAMAPATPASSLINMKVNDDSAEILFGNSTKEAEWVGETNRITFKTLGYTATRLTEIKVWYK